MAGCFLLDVLTGCFLPELAALSNLCKRAARIAEAFDSFFDDGFSPPANFEDVLVANNTFVTQSVVATSFTTALDAANSNKTCIPKWSDK